MSWSLSLLVVPELVKSIRQLISVIVKDLGIYPISLFCYLASIVVGYAAYIVVIKINFLNKQIYLYQIQVMGIINY